MESKEKYIIGIDLGGMSAKGGLFSNFVNAEETSSNKVEIYMLAPENGVLTESFVIKTKNGRLIVLDGGTARTEENIDRPYLIAALRAIAGVGENEYFEVDTWIISHAHGDHFYEMAKMFDQYTAESNYKVNNIYFDFPAEAKSYQSEGIDRFLMGLDNYAQVNGIDISEKSYYDQLNGAFVNADAIANGLEITVDGVRIEFLQTYDLADGSNANEHSMVFRVHAEGQSILFLGDLAINGGARLLRTYGEALKSDMCQMAHHGQDGVAKDVYDAIDADVRFWTTPIWVWNNPQTYQIGDVRSWVNEGVDFTQAGAHDIVACLYEQYPVDYTSVADWRTVKDYMKINRILGSKKP